MRQVIALLATGALVAGGLVGSAAIDDRDPRKARATTPSGGAAATSTASFCDVSRQVNRARRNFFSGLTQRGEASPAQLARAQRRFAELNAQLLSEWQRSAPPAIRADVTTVVTAAASAPVGGDAGPGVRQTQAAVQRVTRFSVESC